MACSDIFLGPARSKRVVRPVHCPESVEPHTSKKLRPVLKTSTRTCFGPGLGTGTSSWSEILEGCLSSRTTKARMITESPESWDPLCNHHRHPAKRTTGNLQAAEILLILR